MNDDFASSARARRQSWGGAKKHLKRALSYRAPHLAMRTAVAVYPRPIARHRLPAPAHLRTVSARMAGVEFVMCRPDRCVVAKELYWGHGRRPQPHDQTALDVFAALARPADLVLDVGAYTGIFSLLAASVAPQAHVLAFELIPASAQAAIDNVVANDLLERVDVLFRGVGAPGESLVVPTGQGGSALPDFLSTKLTFADGVHVPLVSLDEVLGERRAQSGQVETPRRVVMKIDVEGAEDAVLAHGREMLELRPDILCEILPDADAAAVAGALAPHGYRYLPVGPSGLVSERALEPDPVYRDWVFTCRDDAELRSAGVPLEF